MSGIDWKGRESKEALEAKLAEREDVLASEIARLKQWVADCQSGMYINCVYCGHRYGPRDEVPASMADVLKEHVERCPKHPMSALKARLAKVRAMCNRSVLNYGRAIQGCTTPEKVTDEALEAQGGVYLARAILREIGESLQAPGGEI